jgi:hypothetical protein
MTKAEKLLGMTEDREPSEGSWAWTLAQMKKDNAGSISKFIDAAKDLASDLKKKDYEENEIQIKSKLSNKSISAQYVGVTLIKELTDTWYLIGDLIA